MNYDKNVCRFFGARVLPRFSTLLISNSSHVFVPHQSELPPKTRSAPRLAARCLDFLLSNPESMGFYRKSEVTRHYDLLETLGSGSFSIVKRATRLRPSSEVVPDVHVAVKIIDKAKVDNMIDIRVRFLDPVPVHA